MPLTDRVIETDKTHHRVEAEKGARGVGLCSGTEVGEVSTALAREVALELVDRLRAGHPALHPYMAAAERVGGAEAKVRVAGTAGVPGAVRRELEQELEDARAVWSALPAPDAAATEVLSAYAALLALVAADPRLPS
jgi:hypothetical protein